jgi:hypothetical protein
MWRLEGTSEHAHYPLFRKKNKGRLIMMGLTGGIVSSSFLESIGPKARPGFLSFSSLTCVT